LEAYIKNLRHGFAACVCVRAENKISVGVDKFFKKQIIQKLGHGFVEDIPLSNIYQIQVLRGTHKGANFHLSS
jgi:hypothetical protein